MLDQVDRLAHGDDEQELPEVVAVVQAGEPAGLGAAVEAVEGAQRHVLLVGRPPRRGPEPGAGQPDQPVEVASPQLVGGVAVAAT